MVKPASKKRIATDLIFTHRISERRACKLVGLSRTGYRYCHKERNDSKLRDRLKVLARDNSSYGYLFLHSMLKTEGLVVNKKRTYRIYTEEGLQVRTKKRKKLQRTRVPMSVPLTVNERWSMDFVADQLSNGRRFRVLNIMDDFSREMLGQLTAVSITGQQVARFLDQIGERRQLPKMITCDNGTEYTSKAMFFWSENTKVKLGFIQPGKPTQNAFIESLNGKFRNECLNRHWFKTLADARTKVDQWREHYNTIRPHSSLGYLSPIEFSRQAAYSLEISSKQWC